MRTKKIGLFSMGISLISFGIIILLTQFDLINGYDIVMYGHTHVPKISVGEKLTVLNPGSISYPRQEGRKKTFMIMNLDQNGEAHYSLGTLKSSLQDVYRGFY